MLNILKMTALAVLASLSLQVSVPSAAQAATQEELIAFVKRAHQYIKDHGKKEAFDKFNKQNDKEFHVGELYMFAYDYKGVCISHGARPTLIDKPSIDLKDPAGKMIIQEMIKLAKEKGAGTINYRWGNPQHNQVEDKIGYIEDVGGEYFIGSGIYK